MVSRRNLESARKLDKERKALIKAVMTDPTALIQKEIDIRSKEIDKLLKPRRTR